MLAKKINIFEIACTLSHLKAIKTAYDEGCDIAIIMEDDCNFDYIPFKTLPLRDLITYSNDWNCIQLAITSSYYHFKTMIRKHKELYNFSLSGAMAYLINRQGMEKILKRMECKELYVSEVFIFNYLKTYVTKPYFSYYNRNDEQSYIRENTKSAFATQTFSKHLWDNFYYNKRE